MDERQIKRWQVFTIASLYLNLALAAGKFAIGLYSMSIFLSLTAIYSLLLALGKGIALKGYRIGQQPPDESHPHGYGREEYKCYFRVGAILAIAGIIFVDYCVRMFVTDVNTQYTDILAITIAADSHTGVYG